MSDTTQDGALATSKPPSEDAGLTPAELARKYGLSVSGARPTLVDTDRTELVTGEHSGLKTLPQQAQDNPNLAGAL
ncbi:hypothetical protein ACWDA9_39105, partial [Streptomyces sp. NPDC001193]